LPDRQRVAFVLCCMEGLTQAAAARQLGLPEGTLSSRLAHARRQLQERLTRRGIMLSAVLGALAVSQGIGRAVPGRLIDATVQLAGHGAAQASVAALTHGVLKTMLLTRLAVVCSAMLGLGVTATGVSVLRHSWVAEPHTPEVQAPLLAAE